MRKERTSVFSGRCPTIAHMQPRVRQETRIEAKKSTAQKGNTWGKSDGKNKWLPASTKKKRETARKGEAFREQVKKRTGDPTWRGGEGLLSQKKKKKKKKRK